MRVLRLCSVFEAPATALDRRGIKFDTVGGMQNHTAALTRALDRRGVEQVVITTRPPTAAAEHAVGAHSRAVRVGLPVPWLRQGWATPAARLALGYATHVDLVHVHIGEDIAVLPIGYAAARRQDIPLVVTVHTSVARTLRVSGPRSAMLKAVGGRIERWGEARVSAVIALTERLARLLVSDGVPPDRIHVIPSGVETSLFAGQPQDPFPGVPRPRVTFVGRLHVQKGIADLMRAASLLRTPGAHLLVVGDGPERASAERAIRESGLHDRVTIAGAVPHEEVPAVLVAADVVVLPSRYEELGSVLLETMQAGRPIVATDVGGIPDVVTHDVNGLLVPAGDPARLAMAVDRLLADDGLRASMGAAARAGATAYDWSVLADRVLAVYRRALGSTAVGHVTPL